MTAAELIRQLRRLAVRHRRYVTGPPYDHGFQVRPPDSFEAGPICKQAADALESAHKRIAELEQELAEARSQRNEEAEQRRKARNELHRAMDLVRHQRSELHKAGLICDEEYAALADSVSAARLETYVEARKDRERLDLIDAMSDTIVHLDGSVEYRFSIPAVRNKAVAIGRALDLREAIDAAGKDAGEGSGE